MTWKLWASERTRKPACKTWQRSRSLVVELLETRTVMAASFNYNPTTLALSAFSGAAVSFNQTVSLDNAPPVSVQGSLKLQGQPAGVTVSAVDLTPQGTPNQLDFGPGQTSDTWAVTIQVAPTVGLGTYNFRIKASPSGGGGVGEGDGTDIALTVDTIAQLVNGKLVIHGTDGADAIQISATPGAGGTTSVSVTESGVTLVFNNLPAGTAVIAGPGIAANDTIGVSVAGDYDYYLSNENLKVTGVGAPTPVLLTVDLPGVGIDSVNLTGGASANLFKLTNWTGSASLDGAAQPAGAKDKLDYTSATSFTLTDNAVTIIGGAATTFQRMENLRFDASALTGAQVFAIPSLADVTVIGGQGTNTFVIAAGGAGTKTLIGGGANSANIFDLSALTVGPSVNLNANGVRNEVTFANSAAGVTFNLKQGSATLDNGGSATFSGAIDQVTGGHGANSFILGANVIGHGRVKFIGGAGANAFHMGPGSNIAIDVTAAANPLGNSLYFDEAAAGVSFDLGLTAGQVQTVDANGHTVALTGIIPILFGSPFADTLSNSASSAVPLTIDGGGGSPDAIINTGSNIVGLRADHYATITNTGVNVGLDVSGTTAGSFVSTGSAFSVNASGATFASFSASSGSFSFDATNVTLNAASFSVGASGALFSSFDAHGSSLSFDGDEITFDGDETVFDGDEVTFDGDETIFGGSRTLFTGASIHFDGDEATFDGDETVFDGDEVTFTGNGASFDGGRTLFTGASIHFDGDEATFDADETVFDGDEVTFTGNGASFDGDFVVFDGDELTFDSDETTFAGSAVFQANVNGLVTALQTTANGDIAFQGQHLTVNLSNAPHLEQLFFSASNSSLTASNATFSKLLIASGATGSSFDVSGHFSLIENNASYVTAIKASGGAESNTLANYGDHVSGIAFHGGAGTDVFINKGTNVQAAFYGDAGDDAVYLSGTSVNATLDGGAGSDTYTFFGSLTGAVAIGETDASTGDTLDFSSFTGGGINVNLGQTAPQTVSTNLAFTFASANGIENVIGTSAADTIIGNTQNNILLGAQMADDRITSVSPWNGRMQVVYLDFDTYTNTIHVDDHGTNEHVYTPAERNAIEARMEAIYHGPQATSDPSTWWFPVYITQSITDAQAMANLTQGVAQGVFAPVYFNRPRLDDLGNELPGGKSDELDFRNRSFGGSLVIQVNGLLNPAKEPANWWVNASANIAIHEMAHMMGVRHADAFGPIGSGIYTPPGAGDYTPNYPGPSAAFETNLHIITSPASTGSTLTDEANDLYFGEREAVRLAMAFYAPQNPDGGLIVAETANAHADLASAQTLNLAGLYVPNTLHQGALDYGKSFSVAAVSAVGSMNANNEVDVYKFDGKAGDLINMEVISDAVLRPGVANHPLNAVIEVLDANGNRIGYYDGADKATNDDEFESIDAQIIDLRLPANGTYYVRLTTKPADDGVPFSTTPGGYELFLYRFLAFNPTDGGDTLQGGGGSDLMVGGLGNDTFAFANSTAETDTIVGGAGSDTLNFSARTLAGVNVNLATTGITQAIGGGTSLLLQFKDVENVVGTNLADTIVGNDQANVITGNGGSDNMDGGLGDDTFVFANNTTETDTIIGGGGRDTLDFSARTLAGATVNLAIFGTSNGSIQNIGGGTSLLLKFEDIENVVGTNLADIITGNSLANFLVGLAGNDQLTGNTGDDVLLGGAGDDTLVGGDGNDVLVGGLGSDRLTAGTGNDVIIAGELTGVFTYASASDAATLAAFNGQSWANNYNLLRAVGDAWAIGKPVQDLFSTPNDNIIDDAYDVLTGNAGADWSIAQTTDKETDFSSVKDGDKITNT